MEDDLADIEDGEIAGVVVASTDHPVNGIAYELGSDGTDGWVIRLREEPDGVLLRFAPDEREAAEHLFRQLEFFERLPEDVAFPDVLRDRLPPPPVPGMVPGPRRRWHRPSRTWVTLAKTTAALMMIAAATFFAAQLSPLTDRDRVTAGSLFGEEQRSRSSAPASAIPEATSERQTLTSPPAALPGIEVHANPVGGYLFSYPDSWSVESRGGRATLADPDEGVQVVFRPARNGPLAQVSAALVAGVERSRDGVQILDPLRDVTAQGLPAITVGGTFLQGAVEGRFLAIVVGGSTENTSISVFFAPGDGVLADLDDIRAILSSYRVGTAT